MAVRLNLVKANVTPQVKKFSQTQHNLKKVAVQDLTKLKMMHPDACDEDGHMTKHTLGGMAAGAAAGAAAGSVVPVVGTMFGGLAGALVGAFAGATVGLFRDSKK